MESNIDVRAYNREMWNKQVEFCNPWTVPVSPGVIAEAKKGIWSVLLTVTKPVPRAWFPADLSGIDLLCLACGGGQQGPVFAAVGAHVTVFDNSPRQLEQDRMVAEREGLALRTVEGDMRDLSMFADESFDLVLHPVSNIFVDDVLPVWREAYRVLRKGGVLLAGFMNPAVFLFDPDLAEAGDFEARYPLPFDSTKLSEEARKRIYGDDSPLEFSHSLTDQIGGQLRAGFVLVELYEDTQNTAVGKLLPVCIATRAVKR
jgi:SAM-dependent methyltransferase